MHVAEMLIQFVFAGKTMKAEAAEVLLIVFAICLHTSEAAEVFDVAIVLSGALLHK